MVFGFALTLGLSAALLFLIEPMIGKMLLPALGGAPAVWNTCMVFFQAGLLAGYAYAHASVHWLGIRRQALVHCGVVLLPLFMLPIALPADLRPPATHNPIAWLFVALAVVAGLPFFVVASTAPLLQRWFTATSHASARDPYFLYAASNGGSLLGLFAYPLIVEPWLPLSDQGYWWGAGYAVFAGLVGVCALAVWRSPQPGTSSAAAQRTLVDDPDPITAGQRLRWLVLAAVPSSLLLGVTTYVTMDIASFPLLWVLPLALYLLSFIFAFSGTPEALHRGMIAAFPFVLVVGLGTSAMGGVWCPLLGQLGLFFVAALIGHGELARARPASPHLTEYYLWLAAGGVVGGLANALVAPFLFSWIAEYPLALALTCVLLPRRGRETGRERDRWLDIVLPLGIGGLALALEWVWSLFASDVHSWAMRLEVRPAGFFTLLSCALPAAFACSFLRRPVRFGLSFGALLFAASSIFGHHMGILHRERNFFGVLIVSRDPNGPYHRLVHGTTLHGMQSLEPQQRREPLTYYHRTGPIGHVFTDWVFPQRKRRIGIVGLGAGTLAAYGEPGQHFTFFEIDPGIERLARDPGYFTYLADCRAEWNIVLGDARLRMAEAPAEAFDLLVIDAFSSDAIPVHLLTREALRLYGAKLAPGGVVAVHISSGYFRLDPVVAKLAVDGGWTGLVQYDEDCSAPGKAPSQWAILARNREHLMPMIRDGRWQRLSPPPDAPLWTDDYSNLLRVLR